MTAARGSYKFFLEMKKKPALQEVLDNFDDYAHEDIAALEGPVFPVWVKQHLHTMKNGGPGRHGELAQIPQEIEEIANKMQQNHTDSDTPKYEVRRYTGPLKWIGDPSKSQIEGNTGDLFQILGYNEIFWGTNNIKTDHATMSFICSSSESLGIMTALEYKAYNNNETLKKHGLENHEPDPSGKITSADFTHSIDRYRGEILNSESTNNIGASGHQIIGDQINVAGHAVKINRG